MAKISSFKKTTTTFATTNHFFKMNNIKNTENKSKLGLTHRLDGVVSWGNREIYLNPFRRCTAPAWLLPS